MDWDAIRDYMDDSDGENTLQKGSVEEFMCKMIRGGRVSAPAAVSSDLVTQECSQRLNLEMLRQESSSLTPVPQTPPPPTTATGRF